MPADNEAMGKPIEELHISRRSAAVLKNLGITSVGDLLDRCRITGLAKSQPETSDEIRHLVRCIFRASTVNWNVYRSLFEGQSTFPFVPHSARKKWSGRDFVKDLPTALIDAVKLQFGARHAFIFEQRLLKPKCDGCSLRALAAELRVTHERVHAIEKRIIDVLQRSILQDEYRRCRFRFRVNFTEPLRRLKREMQRKRIGRSVSKTQWDSIVREVWDMPRSDLGATETVVLRLLSVALAN
jgi:hypothetical protein